MMPPVNGYDYLPSHVYNPPSRFDFQIVDFFCRQQPSGLRKNHTDRSHWHRTVPPDDLQSLFIVVIVFQPIWKVFRACPTLLDCSTVTKAVHSLSLLG